MTEPTNPDPTASAAWLASLHSVLADLRGGLAKRLEALAASAPDDPAVFAALRSLAHAASVPGPLPAAPSVAGALSRQAQDRAAEIGDAVTRLLNATAKRADALLEKRVNDPAGTIVRVSDFVRCYRLVSGPAAGFIVADLRTPLPPGHPAAHITPYRTPGGELLGVAELGPKPAIAGTQLASGVPLLILGRGTWFWLAAVECNTGEWVSAQRAREAEVRRDDALAAAEARKQFEATAAGQAARVAALAAELAALKTAQAGSPTTGHTGK